MSKFRLTVPGPVQEGKDLVKLSTLLYLADDAVQLILEDCFRNHSDMDESDLSDLQKTLGLEKGCLLRTAAAALFHRVQKAASDKEIEQLKPLMVKFSLLMFPEISYLGRKCLSRRMGQKKTKGS